MVLEHSIVDAMVIRLPLPIVIITVLKARIAIFNTALKAYKAFLLDLIRNHR